MARDLYLREPLRLAVMVFTPEELAWEMSTGRAAFDPRAVPLFDRAVSVTSNT